MVAPSCVVFDIDDTLYLEEDYVRSGFRVVGEVALREFGIGGFESRAVEAFAAGARGDIFDRALVKGGFALEAAVVKRLVEAYRTHTPSIALLPDARLCLEQLRDLACLSCITDGPATSQKAKANALQLHAYLRPILYTAELGEGRSKPHPDAFQRIESLADAKGWSCAYVADNPLKDFMAPWSLGWRTVRIRRRGGLHYNLPSGADVGLELPDLSELPSILGVRP